MADLITHAAVGYLLHTLLPVRWGMAPHRATFVAGSVLPDLLSRLPSLGLRVVAEVLPVPLVAIYIWEPLHMPAGMLLSSYALALLSVAAGRRAVFGSLLAGMGLHLALDVLQDHMGVGYMLLYPLSTDTYELGLIGSEATVPLAPILALLALLRWWQLRRAAGASG